MNRKEPFSVILKKEREQRGWTQEDIAKEIGCEPGTVSRWERGIGLPTPYLRRKLSDHFQMSLEELGLLESPPTVFFSYAQADEVFVNRLKEDLKSQNIVPWSDAEGKLNHLSREHLLRKAFQEVHACILIATPDARSALSVREELEFAELCKCPILVLWRAGVRRRDALPPQQTVIRAIDAIDVRDARYRTAGFSELVMALSQLPPASNRVAGTTLVQELTFEPRNPYKGLKAFDQDGYKDFYGRELLIDELTDKIEEILPLEEKVEERTRLLTILGPSGSGKSSVIKAGLLPRLQAGELPGSEQWVYLQPIIPGHDPLEALEKTLWTHLKDKSLKTIGEDLAHENTRGLHLLALQISKRPEAKVVLLVDQFEELFTQTTNEQSRKHFIDLLLTASTEPDGPMLIILTLRADFYDRPMSLPDKRLGEAIQKRNVSVFPMIMKELRAAVEKPAILPDVQLFFEENLIEELLFEVREQVGALPLLQFTLYQLFLHRSGHRLTRQAFEEMGGVKGAIGKHAEKTFGGLSLEEQEMARALFLRLINPGLTEQDMTRRRALLTELLPTTEREKLLVQGVISAFLNARLLTTAKTPETAATIEISHEALLGKWERLANWLRDYYRDIVFQRKFSHDATEWIQQNRSGDRLYRGTQLAEAQAWAERMPPNQDEAAFLEASVAEQERQVVEGRERQARQIAEERERQARELAQQARELHLRRRVEKRQRYIIVLLAAISVLIIVGLIGASLYQSSLLTAQSMLLTAQNKLLNSLPVSVTNLNDHGPGSLRDAIKNAHSGKVITFARNLGGTIRLTSGDIRITTDVAVIGPGASVLTISGEHKSRVFTVNSNLNVAISNLTVKDGDVTHKSNESFEASGGGIYTELLSALTLTNVVITGNAADFGGGIYNHTGNVTITNSTISNNTALGDGGGIESKGTLTITNSTISNNTAAQDAGGIDNQAALFITNSTISGNTATGDVAMTGYGGGILNLGTANMTYSTLYRNKAVAGGGIANKITNQPANGIGVFLETSIIAGDTATSGPDILGAATLYYPSLIQNTSGADFSSGPIPPAFQGIFELGKRSLLGESPNLAPLQNNGGPTQTYALLSGSPAIDQMRPDTSDQICGSNSLYPHDQRGVARPQGAGCDLGAYEYAPSQGR